MAAKPCEKDCYSLYWGECKNGRHGVSTCVYFDFRERKKRARRVSNRCGRRLG
jgi:hypothetical protein